MAIRGILKNHLKGLKVTKLKEAIRDKYNIDLERVRSHLGYEDIVSFLQDMPGLHLRNSKRIRNCVVQLQPGRVELIILVTVVGETEMNVIVGLGRKHDLLEGRRAKLIYLCFEFLIYLSAISIFARTQ